MRYIPVHSASRYVRTVATKLAVCARAKLWTALAVAVAVPAWSGNAKAIAATRLLEHGAAVVDSTTPINPGKVPERVPPPHTLQGDGNANNADLISPTLCAAACFAATYSFSTVPYFSLDQPRNVTLVYNSDQASPRPFIIADVKGADGTGVSITHFTLSATVNGNPVTFLNGLTQVTFSGSLAPTRLIGQFDARSLGTNIYPMEIAVQAYYADGTNVLKQIPTNLMVLNEAGSQVAKGWTVAGLQRLYSTTSPGYLITGGDGSGVRFPALGATAADYTTLTYDAGSTTYTRTYPNGSRAIFNSTGRQTSFIETDGRTYTFSYDSQGRAQEIRDPYRKQASGAVTAIGLSYDANGLRMIQEPGADGSLWSGRTTWFVVDANRCLLSAQDPDGVSTGFACDADGRLATITDRKGGVTTIGYETNSWKLSTITLPQIAVDAGGGITTLTNPVLRYGPWQTFGQGILIDEANRTISFRVNRFGQAIDVTDPAGLRTTITRFGILPTRITHPSGGTDTLMYDGSGRLIRTHPAGGSRTDYHYSPSNGLLDVISGPGSRLDSLFYTGNQLSRIAYAGSPRQTVDFTYDPATLRLATTTDNSGHTRSYTYDSRFGNLASTTLPGPRVTNQFFDAYGRDSVIAPPGLAAQTSLYDVTNRVTSTSAGSTTVTLAYDQLFQTDLYDANSNHYHTDYNALGWPTRQCDAYSACSTTRYNASGQVMSATNRRGQMVSFTRDTAGRVTSKTGMGLTPSYYSYSSNGRDMVGWNSVQTDSIFSYPGTDLIPATDSVVTWIDGKRFRVFHRAPRAVADIHLTTITSNTGVTFNDRTAFYSTSGFLDSLKIGSTAVRFAPDADGTGGMFTYPDFARSSDALSTHFTGSVAFSNSLAGLNNRAYHYDQAGRIDRIMLGTDPKQIAFGYDALGRLSAREYRGSCSLVSADSTSGPNYSCPTLLSSQYFAYDAMGNRTDNGGVAATGNRFVTLNGATYSYDPDGNVTQKSKPGAYNRQWYWNAEGQLDSAITDGQRVQFDYDAFGRPVRVKEGTSYPLVLQRYLLWDGEALVAQLNPAGQRGVDYVYLPGTIDQPFAYTTGLTSPAEVHFTEQDEVGNVIGSSLTGVLSQEVTYDGWGSHSASNSNQALFWKGLYWNGASTGLFFVRNRWYDPEGGRFVNEDPAGFAGGINLYAFNGNDPINGRDPSGLSQDIVCVYRDLPNTSAWVDGVLVVYGNSYWFCHEFGGSGGEGGGGVGGGGDGTPGNEEIDLRSCGLASGNLFATAVSDWYGLTAVRGAVVFGRGAFEAGLLYYEKTVFRDAGLIGKTRFARVGTPLRDQTFAMIGASGISASTVGHGVPQAAELANAMGDISIWDFVPVVATGRALVKAYEACIEGKK